MNTKLFLRMKMLPHSEVVSTFVAYQRSENNNAEKGRASLVSEGFESVEDEGPLTADGREVFEMFSKRWALRPDVHAERLAAAFAASRQAKPSPEPETKSVVGTESLSAMVCPRCGDALQHTAVCPKCAAGTLGYRHRYTCACGGADLVSKEAL